MADAPRVGLTLPTFTDDPEMLAAAAQRADATPGVDGVFTFDHLFKVGTGGAGSGPAVDPALALGPVLGLLAAETSRVVFGSFVARATVRRPPSLRAAFDTVARIAPGRVVAGVGAGDWLSDPENHMFGLSTGSEAARLAALEATVESLHGRGYPVWVGGRSDRILGTAAALADGWNGWNLSPGGFRLEVERLRAACRSAQRREGAVVPTWGGLVELRPSRWDAARDRADVLVGPYERIAEVLRHHAELGAGWVVLAPLSPTDPDNAEIVAEELVPLLS